MKNNRLRITLLALLLVLSACARDQLSHGGDTVSQETVAEEAADDTEATVDETPPATTVADNEEPSASDTTSYPFVIPDGAAEAQQPSTTSSTSTTTTTEPEPVQIWQDLPDAAWVTVRTQDPVDITAQMEITPPTGVSFNPDGPNVGLIHGVGPCEYGTSWVLGHSHSTGATPALVIHPEDTADAPLREQGYIGVQVGDQVEFELSDGSTCIYEVREFPLPSEDSNQPFTGREVTSVAGSPAMAWEKSRFCPQPDEGGLPHPWTEWYVPTDESVLYFSTSGGWPTITKCNGKTGRPDVDTVYAVLVYSDHPPVYADQ